MNSKQSTFEGVAELTADSGEQSSRDYKAIRTFLALSTTQTHSEAISSQSGIAEP